MITLQERVHSTPVPYRWKLNKLHRVLRVRKGFKNTGMQEDNLLSLSYGRIVSKNMETAEGLLPESFETYQIVEPGNIVLRLTDLQNDKRSLRQGFVNERGIVTSAYDALEVEKGHDPRYWFHALHALDLAKYYYSLGGGVRQSIKFSDFPNDWVAAPDLETQKAIADFLDHETARIDDLIQKKRRLEEALSEKLLSHIARMFSSLDAQKWRVRHLGKVRNGSGFPVELQGDPSQEIGFFKVKHLKTYGLDAVVSDTEDTVFEETARSIRATIFPRGTIVFAKIGAALLLGRFSMLGRDGCIDNNMAAFIPNERLIDPEFALLALSQIDMAKMVQPGAVPSLDTEAFYNFQIPVPDINQQNAFVNEYRSRSQKIKSTISLTEKSIQRLKEYRSALVTAAVTGQVDIFTLAKQRKEGKSLGESARKMEAGAVGVPDVEGRL